MFTFPAKANVTFKKQPTVRAVKTELKKKLPKNIDNTIHVLFTVCNANTV